MNLEQSRDGVPYILDLGTTLTWAVSFKPWIFLTLGEESVVPLELGRLHYKFLPTEAIDEKLR
jgi:hypothetical protein